MPSASPPEGMERETLATMRTGETRYATPWAMWADRERRLWLHPNYLASASAGGTQCMRVTLFEDGYHVWAVPGHAYTPRDTHRYASPDTTQWIPVAALHQPQVSPEQALRGRLGQNAELPL